MSTPADQIQAILAPYLEPGSGAAQFGGIGNLGMQLLANSGPSLVRQPFGAILGRSMLDARANALSQAQARQQLLSGSLGMQRQMMMMQMLGNPAAGAQGGGLPIDQPDGSGNFGNAQPTQPTVPGAAAGGAGSALPPALAQRLRASSAAPAGIPADSAGGTAQNPSAQAGAVPASFQGPSAAPQGAPTQNRPILTPGGSGQLPPGVNGLARVAGGTPNWLTPPTYSQISSMPVGGFNPAMLQRLAVLSGGNPIDTAKGIRAQQMQMAQQKYAAAIGRLDTVAKSDTPTRYVAADPSLAGAWASLAPKLGFDPQKDFTDQNVRTAFTFGRNSLASALSEATVAPNVLLKTSPIGVGGTIQTDPVTGKVTQGAPQLETGQFVLPDGSVRMMTKAAGMRAGLPPFNAETYLNPTTIGGTASLIAGYKMAPLSAQAMRSAQGQAIMANVRAINPNYDATQFTTKQAARQAFATGTQGNTVRSLSVATNHLDQLGQGAVALNNGGKPALNAFVNFISKQWGNPSVTSFDAMKEIVGDEVVKAVVGSSGAEGDRDAIKEAFASATSPAQIQGVIAKYKGLMGSQLSGLQRQYQKATGLNDFQDMVSSTAQSELGSGNGRLGVGQSQKVNGFTVTRTQ